MLKQEHSEAMFRFLVAERILLNSCEHILLLQQLFDRILSEQSDSTKILVLKDVSYLSQPNSWQEINKRKEIHVMQFLHSGKIEVFLDFVVKLRRAEIKFSVSFEQLLSKAIHRLECLLFFNLLKNAICCFKASNPVFPALTCYRSLTYLSKNHFFPKLCLYTTDYQHHLSPSVT